MPDRLPSVSPWLVAAMMVACVAAVAGASPLSAVRDVAKKERMNAQRAAQESKPAAEEPQSAASESDFGLDVLEASDDRVVAVLPNRMVILAQRLPVAPVMSAQVWVETGSIYEQEHVGAGLSHFLEHLLSGGTTTTRTEAESNAILGEIGGQVNAATGLDTARYYINAPAEHAVTAVDLLSDWVRHNAITPAEFAREREVIRSEFAMGRGDPRRVFWKLTQQARYADLPGHPARHPTIGYLVEFNTITREEIVDFYRRMYVPNNMVFVVTGDIDPRRMIDEVARRWHDAEPGDLPDLAMPVASGAQAAQSPDAPNPAPDARTLTARAAINQPRARLAFPGTRLAGEHDYALDLLGVILGQGESSRLVRDLRDQRGLVTSVAAYNLSFSWGEGFFGIDFQPAAFDVEIATPVESVHWQRRIEVVRDAVLKQLQRLRDEPVSDTELARAKRKSMARIVSSGQSAFDLGSRLARDTLGMHDPDYLLEYEKAIRGLTADDLRAAAQAILQEDELIRVTLLPLEAGEEPTPLTRPDEPTADELAGVERERVTLDNAAMIDDVTAALRGGDDRAPIVVDDPVMFTLDNGLRLIVQRSTAVPAAAVRVYWKGGLLADPPDRQGVANAAAEMLTRGTRRYTAAELAETIDNLGASLTTAAGNNTAYVNAFALTEDVPRVIDLVAEVMLRPTFPADEWERTRPRLLAAIDRQRDAWFGELNHAFRQRYYAGHPWSTTPLGVRDVVAALTPADLEAHHASHLSAKDTVIAVVGDVEPEAVRDRVARALADLPASAEQPFEAAAPGDRPAGVTQVATDKPLAAVYVGLGPGVARDHDDYPGLRVLTTVLSDFPGGWLERALRGEGKGIAYAVSAWSQTGLVPGHQAVVFNTRPDTAVEGLAEAFAVLNRARSGEFTDADLHRARTKLIAGEARNRQTNAGRATDYALDTLYGVPEPLSDADLDRLAAVDLEELQRIAAAHLTDPLTVVLTSTPFDADAIAGAIADEPSELQPLGD